VLVWLLIWRTRLGYEIRAFGHSETAAVYAGINPTKIIMITMLISGGLSGMMAINNVMGEAERLVLDFTEGAGFVGIAVALMGRSHPVGVFSGRAPLRGALPGRRRASVRNAGRQPRDDRGDPGARDPVHRRARQHGAHADGEGLLFLSIRRSRHEPALPPAQSPAEWHDRAHGFPHQILQILDS
jgi:hypothetical protein